jgi:hypothetical protein
MSILSFIINIFILILFFFHSSSSSSSSSSSPCHSRLWTTDYAYCCYSAQGYIHCLDNWSVVCLTATKFEPFIRGCIQKFPDWVVTKYTLTINIRWEATQRVMAAKLARLTHKITIQLQLVAESCTICSSRQSGNFWIHPRTFCVEPRVGKCCVW